MSNIVSKKNKVSKKTKKSWRKHVDTKDIDNFLDNVRLEERFGTPFSLRKNEELFAIDKNKKNNFTNNHFTRQQHRELLKYTEPNCFAILKPFTSVSDPIIKRNRIKTKEEKKSSILKQIEIKKKIKEQVAIQNRLISQKNRTNKPKKEVFNVDIWEEKFVELELKNEWLTNDTKRHILANNKRKKRATESLNKKPSIIPAIILPHPGTSYNPSYINHQELLSNLAIDEIKLIKQEKHLNRVTKNMFRKITLKQKNDEDFKEMFEGLPIHQEKNNIFYDEDNGSNIKSINSPVKNIKKTLVQRRKQKEQQKLQQQRLKDKIEKRKVVDIYHLNNLSKQISKKQKKEEILREKRLKIKAKKKFEPKILSRNKFEPIEQEFQIEEELSGNLRNIQPTGNLLKERYKSLQQRNIVAPSTLILKQNKAKVKRFIKADHKINE